MASTDARKGRSSDLPRWTIAEGDAGTRLDKFLAAADRLGSRAKVATALERGKVFLNEVESGIADAGVKLVAGDVVRVWMDRPGSATRQPGPFKKGALEILFEDDALIVGGGMIFVNSGYGGIAARPGNVLLAFGVD